MSLLKWVFQPVYLLLVIILIALYINRDLLFPAQEPSGKVAAMVSKVESLIDDIQSPFQGTVDGSGDGEGTADTSMSVSGNESTSLRADSELESIQSTTETVAAPSPSFPDDDTIPLESAYGERVQGMGEASAQGFSEAQREGIQSVQTETVPTDTDNEADASNTIEEVVTVSGSDDRHSVPDEPARELWRLWQEARQAAWYGDGLGAIERYRAIIALQPDSHDAYGEMGNMMMRMGDTDGAAEAYYQAAHRLLQKGDRMMAWQLLNVIAELSPPRAERLYQELNQ